MAARRYGKLPDEVRREVLAAAMAGKTYRQIRADLNIPLGSVWRVLAPLGGVYSQEMLVAWSPSRLSLEDRIQIWHGLVGGWTYGWIAASLERPRHASTVWREVKANGGREGYRPVVADRAAAVRRRRSKPTKIGSNPALCAAVTAKLELLWSPAQIAAHLREVHGDDASMTVSHETIYKSLYVQGRGELRRELARCLRTGRARRKAQGFTDRRGRIPGMVMISERPAEVADRAVPGHWEGDLVIGRHGESAVGTLVERTTRFVVLLHLEGDRTAGRVRDAMSVAMAQLPAHLRRSVTWDQGIEMAEHARFTAETGMPVYFCDPHSPWQRGSNENTNGLLRQYMPKGTDLAVHTADDLDTIADSLNTRPRKTLGWKTPAQALNTLLVASTT